MPRQVVVHLGGGDAPPPADGREHNKLPATTPTAAACIPSLVEENSSRSKKGEDGQQRSMSGPLKKKMGEFICRPCANHVVMATWWPTSACCVQVSGVIQTARQKLNCLL